MAQVENPKPEDVECLCKLLATIGQLLDASQKGHQVMDAYFLRMGKLQNGAGLESRHKFMIQVPNVPMWPGRLRPSGAILSWGEWDSWKEIK